jgi:phosphatidylglycerophosphate synthase
MRPALKDRPVESLAVTKATDAVYTPTSSRVVKYEYGGAVDALLYPWAWRAAPVFKFLAFTPNWVTTASIAMALAACEFFLIGHSTVAAGLFAVYYFLDLVDGSLARRYDMKSDLGEAYDFVKDAALFNVFAGAILIRNADQAILLAVVNLALGAHLLIWQGNMEAHADPTHYMEKSRRFAGRNPLFSVYLGLVWLYTHCGRVVRVRDQRFFRWLGTGEFVLLAGLTLFFNATWILSAYALLLVVLYVKELAARLLDSPAPCDLEPLD